jgi:hypothetical protein
MLKRSSCTSDFERGLEHAEERRQTLLAIEDVVDRILGVGIGQAVRPEITLRLEALTRAPEQEVAEGIPLVDAVHEEGDALCVPHEPALEGRNADSTTQEVIHE